MSDDQSIVICGATGYIGSNLTARLTQRHLTVKCLVRNESGDVDFLAKCGAQVVRADLTGSKPFKPSVIEALTGAKVLVNLVGSVAPRRGEDFDQLHAEHSRRLASLCGVCGIPKMIMVTALGTSKDAASKYLVSKWKAEQQVIDSGLTYVILRPSLVYGKLSGQRESKLVRRFMELINDRPVVPLIGGGQNRFEPIFISDLLECIDLSLFASDYDNKCFELGGPETVNVKRFIELLMQQLGKSKAVISLPVSVARSIAAVCELTQPVPMLSQDQITLTLSDHICEANSLAHEFGVNPTSLDVGLKTYATASASA